MGRFRLATCSAVGSIAAPVEHASAVDVAEIVARVVEDQIAVRRAVPVDDGDLSEVLFAKPSRQFHEDRAQRRAADGVRARKNLFVADLVRPTVPSGIVGHNRSE